jgi:hypothetical protein
MERISPSSNITKMQKFEGATALADAQKAAEALANSTNSTVFANVIVNGKKTTVPGYPTKDAGNQNPFIKITESKVGKISNPADTARILATAQAAIRNMTTTVEVAGVKYTAPPPARPTDATNAAKGKPGTIAGTNMKQPNVRAAAITAMQQAKSGSSTDENDSNGDPKKTGSSTFEKAIQYNIPREATGKISTLEGVMDGVNPSALKGALGSLPGSFKSLLPAGALPGLLKQSPVPINNLLNIASGKALGSVAGQAVNSVSSGISTGASGLTSSLKSVSLGTGLGLASTRAVLSNVMGSSLTNVMTGNSVKISVPHIDTGAMAKISLNSASAIPTTIPRVNASDPMFSRMASVIGGTVGGRVALLPTNLSVGSLTGGVSGITSALGGGVAGSVSGIAQKLAPAAVSNIFSPSQLTSALPGNVSKLVSSGIPHRTANPSAMGTSPRSGPFTTPPNDITNRRKAAPSVRSILPRGGAHPPVTPPSGSAQKGGKIDYGLIISPGGIKLGEMVRNGKKQSYELPPKGQLGKSLEEIVDGLKYLATNVVDPLDKAFGKSTIESGFRGPGSTNFAKSDHSIGGAVDVSWKSAAKHYEIAQWAVKYIKDSTVVLFFQYAGDPGYIHIAAGPNVKYKAPYTFCTSFDDGTTFKEGIHRPPWAS